MRAELIPPAPDPAPDSLPNLLLFFRTLPNLLRGFTERAYREPVIEGRMFGRRYVLISDPEGARRVLGEAWPDYPKTVPAQRVLRPFIGEGLLLSEGEAWRPQRRRLAPLFTPAAVSGLMPHFQRAAEHMLAGFEGQPKVDLAAAFDAVALDAVLRALFSTSSDALGARLVGLARGYLRGGERAGRVAITDVFARSPDDFAWAQAGRRRFSRAWFAEVDALIAARRAEVREGTGADLLDHLLAARDVETGAALSDEEVRSQCATFIAAGYETTARLLFWAAYLLARDEGEQGRVRAELAAAPVEGAPSLDCLQRWPRLRAVLHETLRLYPSVPMMTRVAAKADEVAGMAIRPGDQISVSPWVMHRHALYWEDPAVFRPSRFQGSFNAHLTEPAFIPFSVGPRVCIGASLAVAEASLVLAALLTQHRISLAGARPPTPVAQLSLGPDRAPAFRLEAA